MQNAFLHGLSPGATGMTNCSGNTPRGHQYASAPYGSAAAAAFTARLALARHGMRGEANTVVDDSMKDSLWEDALQLAKRRHRDSWLLRIG